MLVTRDKSIADRAALLRNQAFEEERFVHRHVGFNYRMTNIQAAIGVAQCQRILEKIRRKREMAAIYDDLLADEDSLQRPVKAEGCQPVSWMYGLVLRDAFGRNKHEVRDLLAAHRIETRSFFIPMHRQPVFQGGHRRWPDLRGHYPVSDRLGERGFYLPSGLDLTYDDQKRIIQQLLSCKH
jgi:perosamine synthetase